MHATALPPTDPLHTAPPQWHGCVAMQKGEASARVVHKKKHAHTLHPHHQSGAAIFAVDVHPSGTRFATGGSDARVRVWSLVPVLDARAEAAGAPRALATLTDGVGAVNALRFSPDGARLAAGSDRGAACIYELRGVTAPGGAGGGPVTLTGDAPPLEHWKVAAHLRGHAENVTDVAWSPDSRRVATASLDNRVGVWDGVTGAHVAWLDGHTSYAKGVAWDPVSKYVASSGDDGALILWSTDGWAPAARVSAPWRGRAASSSTYAARPAWAPDGAFIAACNALDAKAGAHLAPLIERGGEWGAPYSLVGHAGAVVATRAAPHLFRSAANAPPAAALAAGGQDATLSIWLTSRPVPLAVLGRLFSQSVVDAAWMPDGYTVLAVSTDGTCACVQFSQHELGTPLDAASFSAHRHRLYGDERARTAVFAESAGQLALEAGGGGGGAIARAAKPDRLAARLAPASGEAAALGAPRPQARRPAAAAALPRPPASLVPAVARAPPALASPPSKKARAAAAARGPGYPIPPAPAQATLVVPLPGAPGARGADSVPPVGAVDVIVHPTPPGAPPASAVGVSRSGVREWDDLVAGAVTVLAASHAFVAAATADGSLIVWSPAGRRLLPPVALAAPPVSLVAQGWRLLALTADGGVRVWDVAARRGVVATTLAPLLRGAVRGAPVDARLTASGAPLTVLADGTAAAFDGGLGAWLRVDDGSFPSSALATPAPRPDAAAADSRAGLTVLAPLATLANARATAADTRAHLETSLAAAASVGRAPDVRDATLAYVRHLTADADEGRLREVFEELLGPARPVDATGAPPGGPTADAPAAWTPTVGGMAKRDLLRECLAEASRNRAVQRLVAEFAELLGAASG